MVQAGDSIEGLLGCCLRPSTRAAVSLGPLDLHELSV